MLFRSERVVKQFSHCHELDRPSCEPADEQGIGKTAVIADDEERPGWGDARPTGDLCSESGVKYHAGKKPDELVEHDYILNKKRQSRNCRETGAAWHR